MVKIWDITIYSMRTEFTNQAQGNLPRTVFTMNYRDSYRFSAMYLDF